MVSKLCTLWGHPMLGRILVASGSNKMKKGYQQPHGVDIMNGFCLRCDLDELVDLKTADRFVRFYYYG